MNRLQPLLRQGVIREFRRLGCRPTEIVNLLGIPRATVTRHLRDCRLEPPSGCRRHLTALDQWLVTAFWHEVAGRSNVQPPPLEALLRSFCDRCHGNPPAARTSPHPDGLPEDGAPAAPTAPPPAGPAALHDLYYRALERCRREPAPGRCLAGAARFALFCQGLSLSPWSVAVFVSQHVGPTKCAVRLCLRCGEPFISPSPALKQCGCDPAARAPRHLTITRLAMSGLSPRA